MALDGYDAVLIIGHRPFVASTKHESNAGSVDITIAEPGLGSRLRKGEGQIGRDGGLANTAFSAGHGDDMLHALDLRGANRSGGGGGSLHIDFHRHTANPSQGLEGRCRLRMDFFCDASVICR